MTSSPTHPDLLALLRGELTNVEVLDAADHLDRCEPCRAELADTATGHALLASSARALGPVAPIAAAGTAEVSLPPAPDLKPWRHRQRRRRLVLGVAAATVAGIVWTGGYLTGGEQGSPPVADPAPSASPEPPSGDTRTVTLAPVEGSGSGTVSMTETGTVAVMRIVTQDLRPLEPGKFYYAWLLDPVTNKMLPLGQVGPDGTVSFEVSPILLASYSAIDVSLESDDGDPGHSPRSVLRAVYA